ncbi:hypothetical protein, partial [Clostridium sp.]|uniref:hypothetical protein n=1 Tax=Clostridium sp. TaxID=1506 RepID=UPI00260A8041
DPWVSKEDWKYLGIKNISYDELKEKSFDAVIAAVNHEQFVDNDSFIDSLCTQPKVVVDVKGALSNPDWRL